MSSPSKVDPGSHAHAFEKYLAQHHKAVCVELPSRKHVQSNLKIKLEIT